MLSGAQAARRRRCGAGLAAVLAGPLLAAGCSSYVATGQSLRPLLVEKQYAAALQRIEGLDSGTSRLLYLYERGQVLHHQSRFEDSNASFQLAEELLEDLYTRSASREAGALVVSETVREYRGERYEATLAHYYRIMNYVQLGQLESAAVQCRRLNHRLQVFHDQGGSFYTDDPFLQYLTGMVYAAADEPGEADVSFRAALDAYRARAGDLGIEMPGELLCDLAKNALRLGDREAAHEYGQEGDCEARRAGGGRGQLRLLLECGWVAFKDRTEIVLPIFKNEIHDGMDLDAFAVTMAGRRGQLVPAHLELEYLLRVSMPVLRETPSGIQYARITARAPGDTSRPHAYAVVGLDVTALAQRSFAEEQGAILVRAVARGLTKYLATRAAKKQGGDWAGWAVNFAGVLTETADTRSWSTLPERILLGQLDLPAGRWTLRVELFDPAGRLDDAFDVPEVEIAADRATLLNYRVY